MATTIYYFSGTGNSLDTARQLAQRLGDTQVVPIVRYSGKFRVVPETETFGLVFPLYYFGLPLLVKEFVKSLEFHKDQYMFTVVTKGGSQGIAIDQLNDILSKRLKRLSAGFYLNMPGNYIPMYEVASQERQEKVFENARQRLDEMAETISSKKPVIERKNFAFKLFAPVVYNSWAKGANKADQAFVADDNCDSCGLCRDVCPVSNIRMAEGRPRWQNRCQECLACIHFCPRQAIQVGNKTINRGRYHHPRITARDIMEQKS